MSRARKILADALTLDERERATLALALMDSLAPPDARDEDAWIDEIEQRARRAMAGAEPGAEMDAALDRIARDLGV